MFSLLPFSDVEISQINGKTEIKETKINIRCERNVLLILPGKTIVEQRDVIDKYISEYDPVIIGVNAINETYHYDYLFFSNNIRYDYAGEIFPDTFSKTKRIVTSNVKTAGEAGEYIVNFNLLVKRGWEHFDNSGIMCLRLMNKLRVSNVLVAGFDGFEDAYSESYADVSLPHINPGKKWEDLNQEIKDMFLDLKKSTEGFMKISLITKSKFSE